jgi:hypothetical protein
MKAIIRINLTILFVLIVLTTSKAQQNKFAKVIYGMDDYPRSVHIDNILDNSYIVAFLSFRDLVVVKMDSVGTLLWSKVFNENLQEFNSITKTTDSCFILTGSLYNSVSLNSDIFCIKMNADGNTIWSKKIDLGYSDFAYSVQQTNDKGFILAGCASNVINSAPYDKIALVKLDSTGNINWSKIITGGDNENLAFSIKQTADSGYIVTGFVENISPVDAGMFIMKLTTSGEISWSKKYLESSQNYAIGFDVNVIAGGLICYFSNDSKSIIMKTDLSGNILWSKSISTNNNFNIINSTQSKLIPTDSNGYVFYVANQSDANLIIKVDSVGKTIWSHYCSELINDMTLTKDKGILLTGGQISYLSASSTINGYQIGIIKTDSLGNSSDCISPFSISLDTCVINTSPVTFTSVGAGSAKSFSPIFTDIALSVDEGCVPGGGGSIDENKLDGKSSFVYPNPTNGFFQLKIDQSEFSTIKNIIVFNILGKKVFEAKDPDIISSIDLSKEPNGIYNIELVFKDYVISQKFIIFH